MFPAHSLYQVIRCPSSPHQARELNHGLQDALVFSAANLPYALVALGRLSQQCPLNTPVRANTSLSLLLESLSPNRNSFRLTNPKQISYPFCTYKNIVNTLDIYKQSCCSVCIDAWLVHVLKYSQNISLCPFW